MFTPTAAQQQVFTLSCLSGLAAQRPHAKGFLQEQLQALESVIGTWNVVWGPCFTPPLPDVLIPRNTMYAAQNAGGDQIVVAIAGTDPESLYDWLREDLDITPIAWPYASNAGEVTTGDNNGLTNLLQMKSGKHTLQEFLSNIPNKSAVSLTFTGHSLGGALSPMLALALMDPASTLTEESDVSIGNWAEVSLLATAGPSIGDAAFLSYFNSTLADASCTFIWNANDIVPHAWNKATLMELTSPANIYDLTLDPTQCLAKQLALKQSMAAACNYTVFEPTPAFAGPIQPYTLTGSGTWSPESQFLAQALYQHTSAYRFAFECNDWFVMPPNPCTNPKEANTLLEMVNSLCL